MKSSKDLQSLDLKTFAIFFSPFLLGAVVAGVLPVAGVSVLSLGEWDLITTAKWVGLDNFAKTLSDTNFLRAISNSIYIAFLATLFQISLGVYLGRRLSRSNRAGLATYTFYLTPWLIAPVAIGVVSKWLFQPVGGLLSGFLDSRIPLLTDPILAPLAIAVISSFSTLGYTAVFLSVGLRAVQKSYIEEAAISGATAWQTFIFVEAPILRNFLFFMVATSTLQNLNIYDLIATLTGPGLDGVTDVASLHVVSETLTSFDFGYSSAMAITFAVIQFAIIAMQAAAFLILTRKLR